MVIPDGILTNSSVQYVRDQIEAQYRIIAVVSLPQTAFAATGAGVKSSVLFLKKHTANQTKAINDARQGIKDLIKEKHSFLSKLAKLDKAKRDDIKNLKGFERTAEVEAEIEAAKAEGKKLEDTAAYAAWKKQVGDSYNEKIDALKYQLSEEYAEATRAQLPDYDIFMAIAEDIGYDATGRDTKTNELESIGKALAEFIGEIEANQK